MDPGWGGMAQPLASLLPQQVLGRAHGCDDSGGHDTALEHHGVSGALDRAASQAHRQPRLAQQGVQGDEGEM